MFYIPLYSYIASSNVYVHVCVHVRWRLAGDKYYLHVQIVPKDVVMAGNHC